MDGRGLALVGSHGHFLRGEAMLNTEKTFDVLRGLTEARPIALDTAAFKRLMTRLVQRMTNTLQHMQAARPGQAVGEAVLATSHTDVKPIKGTTKYITVVVQTIPFRATELVGGAFYDPSKELVVVTVNGQMSPATLLGAMKGTGMSSVAGAVGDALKHELTHVRDVLRNTKLEALLRLIIRHEEPSDEVPNPRLQWELHKFDANIPYSDRQLANIFKRLFQVTVTPRMVSKLRQKLGLPISSKRMQGWIMPDDPEEKEKERISGYKSYVNNPEEVRAHMQQVVSQVVHQAPTLLPQMKKLPRSQQVSTLLKQSKTWLEIKDKLNRRNQNRIRKAVATVVREFLAGLPG